MNFSPDLDPGKEDKMTEANITVTDSAAKRIAQILSKETDKNAMRVSVEGGGCSGFSYKFDLVGSPESDDIILEKGEAKVLIDRLSVVYMDGSEIDFVDNLMGQSFQIKNPNAVASCGCGTSFSV
jgi:iron-sulfur cluster assembly accessory protein